MTRALVAALTVIGAALLVTSRFLATAPLPGGGHTLEAWWVGAAGFALLVAGLVLKLAGPRSALLAGASTLGTAAWLGLTQPAWLQVLRVRPHDLADPLILLGACALGLQALITLVVAWRLLRPMKEGALALTGARTLSGLALVFIASGAHATLFAPTGNWVGFALQLLATFALWLLALVTLIAFAASWEDAAVTRRREAARRWFSWPGGEEATARYDGLLPTGLALFVATFAVSVSRGVFDGVPHIPDGVAYLFQARTFAAGALSFPAPEAHEAFRQYLIDVRDGQWFAVTPPGWPAVLALGAFFDAEWLVNPLLGALGILLGHGVARRLGGRGLANLVAVLMATSPWYLFLASSMMTHTLSLCLVLGAWRLLLGARHRGLHWSPLVAGFLMGHLAAVRPLDGALMGAFTGGLLLWGLRHGYRFAAVIAYGVGILAGGALLLLYNRALTGNPLEFPIQAYLDALWYPGANRLGFGADVGNTPTRWGNLDPWRGHGLRDVLVNTNQNLYNLQFELFGWSVGSLLVAAWYCFRRKLAALERTGLVLLGLLVAGYSLYWFSGGPDFGPRYWFLMLFPATWLTARGLTALAEELDQRFPGREAPARLGLAVALLSCVSLGVFASWRITAKYRDYRGFHSDFVEMEAGGELGRGVIFVRSPSAADYASAFLVMHPALPDDRPVFVRERGEAEDAAVRAAWPDRPVGRVFGRHETKRRSEIAEPPK